MSWQFSAERPIYSQLVEHMSIFIITGRYPAGSRLPSVRELAGEAKVNPNTMQRALAELESSGLVFAERTSGRFVTEDRQMIQATLQQLAEERIIRFFAEMEKLGISAEQALALAAARKTRKEDA